MGILNFFKKKKKWKVDNSIHKARILSMINDLTISLSTVAEEEGKKIMETIDGLKNNLEDLRREGEIKIPTKPREKSISKTAKEENEEEKRLTEIWSKKINNAQVFHGTTQNLLDSITQRGMTTTIELYDPEDAKILKQLYMNSPTLSWKIDHSYILGDKEHHQKRKALFLTGSKKEAKEYAKQTAKNGPEYIRHLLAEMELLQRSIEAEETPADTKTKTWLTQKIQEYTKRYTNQKPVLISIDIKNSQIMNSFDEEIRTMINDPLKFKEIARQAINTGVAKDFEDYCTKFKEATFGEFRVYEQIPPETLKIEEL